SLARRCSALLSYLLSLAMPFFSWCRVDHRSLHSFPTRRSSDLAARERDERRERHLRGVARFVEHRFAEEGRAQRHAIEPADEPADRKSTRLNSSHVKISYAVVCLKKKTQNKEAPISNPNNLTLL